MAVASAMAMSLSLSRPAMGRRELGRCGDGGRMRLRRSFVRMRACAGSEARAEGAESGSTLRGGGARFSTRFCLVLDALARSVGRMREEGVQKIAAAREKVLPEWRPQTEEEKQLLTALKGRLVCAAAPVFFAAISQSAPVNTPLTVVASGMAKWLELYSGVLMVRVLLSWFPNIPWERQPLQAMRDMCDPYLNLFRNIIPPLFNALDLSPMLAFLVLGVLTSILNTTVQAG